MNILNDAITDQLLLLHLRPVQSRHLHTAQHELFVWSWMLTLHGFLRCKPFLMVISQKSVKEIDRLHTYQLAYWRSADYTHLVRDVTLIIGSDEPRPCSLCVPVSSNKALSHV